MILRERVHLSTLALVTIATFDLVTTLLWLHAGQAEGNPFFNSIARHGSLVLALAKLVFIAVPVAILEFARTKRPISADIGTWLAAALYAALYTSHLIQLQHQIHRTESANNNETIAIFVESLDANRTIGLN